MKNIQLDEKELEEIQKLVLSVSRRYLRNYGLDSLAEDVVSEIMIAFLSRPERLAEVTNIKAYALTMVRHHIYRYLRENRHNISLDETVPDARANEAIEKTLDSIRADRMLAKLIESSSELEKRIVSIIVTSNHRNISRREIVRRLKLEDLEITRYKVEKVLNQIGRKLKHLIYEENNSSG